MAGCAARSNTCHWKTLGVQAASLSVRFKTEGTLRYDARPDVVAP